jgi:hypothetical protein
MRFFGGPLDGQNLAVLDDCPVGYTWSMPISEAMLDYFGTDPKSGAPVDPELAKRIAAESPTSAAQYEIRLRAGVTEAHFVRAATPAEHAEITKRALGKPPSQEQP